MQAAAVAVETPLMAPTEAPMDAPMDAPVDAPMVAPLEGPLSIAPETEVYIEEPIIAPVEMPDAYMPEEPYIDADMPEVEEPAAVIPEVEEPEEVEAPEEVEVEAPEMAVAPEQDEEVTEEFTLEELLTTDASDCGPVMSEIPTGRHQDTLKAPIQAVAYYGDKLSESGEFGMPHGEIERGGSYCVAPGSTAEKVVFGGMVFWHNDGQCHLPPTKEDGSACCELFMWQPNTEGYYYDNCSMKCASSRRPRLRTGFAGGCVWQCAVDVCAVLPPHPALNPAAGVVRRHWLCVCEMRCVAVACSVAVDRPMIEPLRSKVPTS